MGCELKNGMEIGVVTGLVAYIIKWCSGWYKLIIGRVLLFLVFTYK